MADFCKQCSLDIFKEDFRDLAMILTDEELKEGIVARVICEGCGVTYVNQEGECVYEHCLKEHGRVPTHDKPDPR